MPLALWVPPAGGVGRAGGCPSCTGLTENRHHAGLWSSSRARHAYVHSAPQRGRLPCLPHSLFPHPFLPSYLRPCLASPHAQDGVAAALRKDVCAHLGHVHFCEEVSGSLSPPGQPETQAAGQQALSATTAGGLWGLIFSLILDLHK